MLSTTPSELAVTVPGAIERENATWTCWAEPELIMPLVIGVIEVTLAGTGMCQRMSPSLPALPEIPTRVAHAVAGDVREPEAILGGSCRRSPTPR